MASSSLSFSFLLFTIFLFSSTHAKTAPVAPGPTQEPLSLTKILEKGSQYTTLLRLLKETQVSTQINSQLNSSYDGLTIFAPTDNAFHQLKAGTLNSLTDQEQVELVLFHVLPRFYSLTTFESASNPVSTQASGNDGVYTMNVTTTSNQVDKYIYTNRILCSILKLTRSSRRLKDRSYSNRYNFKIDPFILDGMHEIRIAGILTYTASVAADPDLDTERLNA